MSSEVIASWVGEVGCIFDEIKILSNRPNPAGGMPIGVGS